MSGNQLAGKRIGAGIIDSIIVGIVSAIPVVVYLFVTYSGIAEDQLADMLLQMIGEGETIVIVGTVFMDILLVTTLSQLFFGVLYFGVLPTLKDGQTWGKMLLKIKAVDVYGENPSFWKHILRAIQNWSVYVTLPVLLLAALAQSDAIYYAGSSFSNLVSLAFLASVIMLFAMQDGRGLHDMLAKTRVVSTEPIPQSYSVQDDWVDHSDTSEENENQDWTEEKKDEWDF